MKKTIIISLIFVSLSTIVFFACKKNNQNLEVQTGNHLGFRTYSSWRDIRDDITINAGVIAFTDSNHSKYAYLYLDSMYEAYNDSF